MTVTTNMLDHTPANRVDPYGMTMIKFGEGATLHDVVTQADLDYTIRKNKRTATWDDTIDGWVEIPSRNGIVADHQGSVHGITTVGTRYQPIQHLDTLEKIDPLVREGFMRYSHAGRDGFGKVFVLYTLEDEVSFVGDYPHARQLMFSTAHDGTGAWRWRPWFVDLFCTNQRGIIFGRKKAVISQRHSGRAFTDQIHSMVLGLLDVYQHEDDMLTALAQRVVGPREVEKFVTTLVPDPKNLVEGVKPFHSLERGEKRAFTSIMERRTGLRNIILGSPTMNALRDPFETAIPAHVLVHGAVEWSDYAYNARGGVAGRGKRILNGTDMPFKRLAARTALAVAGVN